MRLTFLIFLLVVFGADVCFAQEPAGYKINEDLLRRFESEAPKAWQKAKQNYLSFARNNSCQRDGSVEVFKLPKGKANGIFEQVVDHRNQKVSLGESYGVFKAGLGEDDTKETVSLFNKSYYALLQRDKGSSEWLLKSIGTTPEYNSDRPLPDTLGEIDRTLSWAADLMSLSIHPFNENPYLRGYGIEKARSWPELRNREITSIEFVNYDGSEMVRVAMTFNIKTVDWKSGNGKTNLPTVDLLCRYTAIFDPANFWCLREGVGGIVTEGKVIHEEKLTYSYTNFDGVQICEKCMSTTTQKQTNVITSRSEKANNFTKVRLSPKDFTLTAFGLPEPDWYRTPTPWWLYTSLAGLGLLLGGAILFRFGKKIA